MLYIPSIWGEDLFDDFMRMPTRREVHRPEGTDWSKALMRTDILEVGDNYQLEVELPGFTKEEVKLHLKDGNLTIEAAKEKTEETNEEGKYLRKERFSGSCSRTFFVGKDLSHEDIKAKYDKGVLTVTFPKEVKKEVEEKKYISIEG
jgi:HSP20 family molecular chaperone IbpA